MNTWQPIATAGRRGMSTVELLKKCRIEGERGRWLCWDDDDAWVIRERPYRAKNTRIWSTHLSLHDALEELTKEGA